MDQKLKEQMCERLIAGDSLNGWNNTITGLASAFYSLAIMSVGISVAFESLKDSNII